MSKPIPGENIVELKNKSGGFPFQLFGDLTAGIVAKRHLIKGAFALGETSAWVAPPGGLKSALLAQASVCVAGGLDWHGKKNKGAVGVVYFALERADLVKRRLQAHRERANLGDLPIAVVGSTVDLMAPATVAKILATIKEAEESFGRSVGLVIFDTFAKLIAAGGGDEDKARDQGRVFSNIQRVKESADIHVAIVGHTGKDESRGMRGSNAALGDADTMHTISGDVVRTVTVTKANDGPEGPLFSFKSEIHDFGTDEDGDPITVNVVSDEVISVQSAQKTAEPKLTANQKTMFGILHEAGLAGLTTEDWNSKAKDIGIGIRRRADLTDIRSALKAKRLIRDFGERWTVQQ
jgi:AAA domain